MLLRDVLGVCGVAAVGDWSALPRPTASDTTPVMKTDDYTGPQSPSPTPAHSDTSERLHAPPRDYGERRVNREFTNWQWNIGFSYPILVSTIPSRYSLKGHNTQHSSHIGQKFSK